MFQEISISSLQQDSRNANKGTKRGRKMVKDSLQKLGAGRSVLVDRDGRLIAGNKTAEAAAAAGFDRVIIVPTDGKTLVAVQRTDLSLDDAKAQELAIADNRAGQVGLAWDVDNLKAIADEGVELTDFFQKDEQIALGILDPAADAVNDAGDAQGQSGYKEQYGVIVICADEEEQKRVFDQLSGEGFTVRVVVT